MKILPPKSSHQEHAQALLEFALIVPLLLTLIYGIIEFGRLLAVYSMISTASREGSRYGAASGDVGGSTPHYADCAGILAATKKQAVLVNLQDSDITISYDHGPGTAATVGCPPADTIHLGDRIVVEVVGGFNTLVPITNIPPMTIRSKSARTILKDISIKGTLPPPVPTNTRTPVIPTETLTRTPTITPTPSATPTNTSTITPTTPNVPSVTPTNTRTPTRTPTFTPTFTPTNTPTATPNCNIFDDNPLEISSLDQRISWQVLNLRPDTLELSVLTVGWPSVGGNPPKLDYITFDDVTIWDGNVPSSPHTVDAWTGFVSDRTLFKYPDEDYTGTVALFFTRDLDGGTYTLSLTFHDVELNIDCTVSTSRDWLP